MESLDFKTVAITSAILCLSMRFIRAPLILRQILCLVIIPPLLYPPLLLPTHYQTSLMTAVLSWIVAQQCIYTLLIPEYPTLLALALYFLWPMVPAFKSETPIPPKEIILNTISCLLSIAIKFILAPIFREIILFYLQQPNVSVQNMNILEYTAWTCIFGISMLSGTWVGDVFCMLVPILTAGRFKAIPFCNFVILSTSLKEFWAKRYNLLISNFFKYTVFLPFMQHLRWTPMNSSLLVFGLSGVLHMYCAQVAFGTGILRAFIYFAVQGALVSIETNVYKRYPNVLPVFAKWLLTFSMIILTLPIYAALFLDASPQWIINNAPTSPLHEKIAPVVHQYLTSNFS